MTTFRVEPAFAETLAWRALDGRAAGGRPDALRVHHERAADLYEEPADSARERAFERLAAMELGELEVMLPLADAIEERPTLAAAVAVVIVGEAPAASVEGVTFDPLLRRLGVSLQARRFDDPAGLRSWARHALGHTEDVIDPAFAFEPDWDRPIGQGRFVERLHALWDVTVDARAPVPRATGAAASPMAADRLRRTHERAVKASWPELAEAAPVIVERLWSGPRPSFPQLRGWAEDPAALAAAVGRIISAAPLSGPQAGICPLCRFPCAALELPTPALVEAVGAEFPGWRPDERLCGRCGDRYRFAQLGGVA
jgi:hypothetical protein